MGRLDEYNRALNAVTTALVGGVAGQGAGQVASNALAAYAAYFIGSKLDPNHGSDPKAAKSVKALGSQDARLGTFDSNLKKIGGEF
ncbi:MULTISPECIES: toxin C-terminal domain-containing protein [Stenotrophomonas]|uniref:Novel toxin 21 domain-containing protein n=1 Tax=Stenotrophomonas maltophilia TaxID=40324 RepID=A0A431UK64_STEMA|nr:toxin C-terminal domain-containing protein [Stenotrophomonas maltophilia]RTQ90131.1 hypothetical protein EKL94_07730 [Stenotrophomonas maltophilia]